MKYALGLITAFCVCSQTQGEVPGGPLRAGSIYFFLHNLFLEAHKMGLYFSIRTKYYGLDFWPRSWLHKMSLWPAVSMLKPCRPSFLMQKMLGLVSGCFSHKQRDWGWLHSLVFLKLATGIQSPLVEFNKLCLFPALRQSQAARQPPWQRTEGGLHRSHLGLIKWVGTSGAHCSVRRSVALTSPESLSLSEGLCCGHSLDQAGV